MYQITIDGLSGSGKSSVAKGVAESLNILFFNSDLFKDAIALTCIQRGINPTDEDDIKDLIESNKFEYIVRDSNSIVLVNGNNVMNMLNNRLIAKVSYELSKSSAVNDFILKKQLEVSRENSLVVEGFNSSKTVFPNSKFKFFLNADLETRARRRYEALINKGVRVTYDDVLNNTIDYDRAMFSGEMSKVDINKEAFIIDTTNKTAIESVNIIYGIVKKGIA